MESHSTFQVVSALIVIVKLLHSDLHLQFDEDGKHFTRFYDKRDDFDFPIVHYQYFKGSNIPESLAYGVFVDTLCLGLFEIWRLSVQRKYSGFKVIETGISPRIL